MTTVRQWVALAVLACAAVLVGAWFLLVAPQRAEAADLGEQTAAQDQANLRLRQELELLRAQSARIAEQHAALRRVAEKVPAEPDLPSLLRSLAALADSTGVTLTGLAPGPAAPGGADLAVAEPAEPAADPAAATWSRLPLTIDVAGGFWEVQAFVQGLEELPRAVRVLTLAARPGASPLEPGTDVDSGRALLVTLSAEAYTAAGPAPAAVAAGAPVAALGAPPTATPLPTVPAEPEEVS